MKKATVSLCFLVLSLSSLAAQDIASVFLSMPDAVLYGLEADQKEKLLVNIGDSTVVGIETAVYKQIKRLASSTNFISLQTSPIATTQIRLLPLVNDSKIICVIKTVCGAICDSQIQFYTTKWLPISQANLFPTPTLSWFLKPNIDLDNPRLANSLALLDMQTIKYTFSSKEETITAEYGIKNYLSSDDYALIEPLLAQEPKVLYWDKAIFK